MINDENLSLGLVLSALILVKSILSDLCLSTFYDSTHLSVLDWRLSLVHGLNLIIVQRLSSLVLQDLQQFVLFQFAAILLVEHLKSTRVVMLLLFSTIFLIIFCSSNQ